MKRALATEYTQNPDMIKNGSSCCRYTVPVAVTKFEQVIKKLQEKCR